MTDVETESENNVYSYLLVVKWLPISKICTSTGVLESYVSKEERRGLNFGKDTLTCYRDHIGKYLIWSEAPMLFLTGGAKKDTLDLEMKWLFLRFEI